MLKNIEARVILANNKFLRIYSLLEKSHSSVSSVTDVNNQSFVKWSVWKKNNVFILLTSKSRKREEEEGYIDKAYLYVKAPSISVVRDVLVSSSKINSLGNGLYEIIEFSFLDIENIQKVGEPLFPEDYFKFRLFPYTKKRSNVRKREKIAELISKCT